MLILFIHFLQVLLQKNFLQSNFFFSLYFSSHYPLSTTSFPLFWHLILKKLLVYFPYVHLCSSLIPHLTKSKRKLCCVSKFQITKMTCAFSILWEKMHYVHYFFIFSAKHKSNLTWPNVEKMKLLLISKESTFC